MTETNWPRVLMLYGAGLVAALQLGKVAPVGPVLQSSLGLSLTDLGWLVSAITGVGAAMGAAAGLLVRRMGSRNALVLGLLAMGCAGLAGAAAATPAMAIGARLCEGVGYVLVVVAAPNLMVASTQGRDQAAALSLWGTFVPVGLAAGAFLSGLLAPEFGWRIWLAAATLTAVPLALVLFVTIPAVEETSGANDRRSARTGSIGTPLMLALAFGATAAIAVGFLGLLPTFLIAERGTSAATAGTATAAVSLFSLGGGFVAGWLFRRRVGLRVLAPAAALMPLGIWLACREAGSLPLSVMAGGLALVVNGTLISALFAAVPQILRSAADIGFANGLIVQFGSIGALAGPPLFNAGVAAGGWPAAAALTLALSIGAGALLVPLSRPALAAA